MENVIDVAFHVTWDTPLFVRIGNGFRERIDGKFLRWRTYLVRRGDGPTPSFGGRLKLFFTVLRVGGWKECLNEERARKARL